MVLSWDDPACGGAGECGMLPVNDHNIRSITCCHLSIYHARHYPLLSTITYRLDTHKDFLASNISQQKYFYFLCLTCSNSSVPILIPPQFILLCKFKQKFCEILTPKHRRGREIFKCCTPNNGFFNLQYRRMLNCK